MNINKLIDILILFSKNGQELCPLRINKLLYFVDKYHLRKYGRFVIDDKYFRLPLGPVPSSSYNLIDDFFEPISIKGRSLSPNPLSPFFNKEQRGKHNILKLKNERPPDFLSASEKEAAQEVLNQYGKISTSRLVDLAHAEKTSRETAPSSEISMDLFLDGLPASRKEMILGLIEIDEENLCLRKYLNR